MPLICFKSGLFPKDTILYAVFFYVRYFISYHDLEEIMGEVGFGVIRAVVKSGLQRFMLDSFVELQFILIKLKLLKRFENGN
jgi:transposase-like protein